MVNVVFIASRLQTGGAERQWYELIKGMDRARFNVIVVCLYDPGPMEEQFRDLGVKMYSSLLKSRLSFFGVLALSKVLKREHADVVFLWNQPLTMLYGTVAARMAGIKGIVTAFHTTGHLEKKVRAGAINRLLIPFVSKIVALGTLHREYIVRHERVSPEKVVIIFNGVELEEYAKGQDKTAKKWELGIPADAKVVGIVARLHKVKRHDIFLRAAKVVLNRYKDVFFIIVGDGGEREKIEGLIKELGLGERVKMLGMRKDISEINGILGVAVVSSDAEALPMAVIEAMASSVPVVSTRVGSVEDLLKDGENGFLVNPGSPEELAGAILKILGDESLAAGMGRRGRELASANFSRKTMVKKYEELFLAEASRAKLARTK